MNKRGFTFVELIAVIAIIGILSVIVVPNIIKINQNVDVRLAEEKKDHIINAAELYGNNNPDLFAGTDTAEIKVNDLVIAGYLDNDSKEGCAEKESNCIINPAYDETKDEKEIDGKKSFNDVCVKLVKKNTGIVASFDCVSVSTSGSATLVSKVCAGYKKDENDKNYEYIGQTLGDSPKMCKCKYDGSNVIGLVDFDGNSVDACILVADENGNINNWLKYGSSSANWRVIGLYKIDGKISAKMITASLIEE